MNPGMFTATSDNNQAQVMSKIKTSLLNKQEHQPIPAKSRNPRSTISLTQQDRESKSQKTANELIGMVSSGTYNQNQSNKNMT